MRYTSPGLEVRLDSADFSLLEAKAGEEAIEGQELMLETCAGLYVVLKGLSESMPHLPWASPPGSPVVGCRVEHPGYEE